MKQLCVLFLILSLLTGCSSAEDPVQQGMDFRSALLNAEGCSFQTCVTADYSDRIHSFSMECKADENGNLCFTVMEPESIEGISGKLEESGGKLTFSETLLAFPLLAEEQITPVTAPWILIRTLRAGYLKAAGREEDGLHLTLEDRYEDCALMVDVWLNEENDPVQADILYGGRRILSLAISNFQLL